MASRTAVAPVEERESETSRIALSNGFDLNEQETLDYAVLKVRDVRGKPAMRNGAPVTITLYSTDTQEYRDASSAVQKLRAIRQREGLEPNLDDMISDNVELFSRVTKEWSGMAEGGQELPSDRKSYRRIYAKYPFLREQVQGFLNMRSNFLPESSER